MAEASHRGRPGCECAERLLGEYDEFILFDTETTGFSPASCALIEVSALKIRSRGLQVTDELTVYIRPRTPVPRAIESLTGITNTFLAGMPFEEDVFDRIAGFFAPGIPCGAYNTHFDRSFMEALYARHDQDFCTGREFFDVLRMAKELIAKEDVGSHSLSSLVRQCLPDTEQAFSFHDAKEDVRATLLLFEYLYREYLSRPEDEASQKAAPVIRTIQSWRQHNCARIYVNLRSPYGTVYYDLKESVWRNKDRSEDILSLIDLNILRAELLRRTGAATEAQLWNFEGKA